MIIRDIAGYVADLGIDVAKSKFQNKLDEKKLRDDLVTFIESQNKYNEMCTYAEEIDFQGLMEYIKGDFIESACARVFDPNPARRKQVRDQIASEAQIFCKANTEEARYRVSTCIYICLDIIKKFYKSHFTTRDYIWADMIVDAVVEEVQHSSNKIVTEMNSIKDELAEKIQKATESASSNQGTLYSIDKAVALAETGRIDEIGKGVKKVLDCISTEHPYYPDFGYDYIGGRILSKPLTEEAKVKYPPKFNFTGAIRFGNQYYNDPKGNPLDYSYRHQIPITMEVSKALKLLGERPDPNQTEAEELIGGIITAIPPEFPPAIPCALKAGERTYCEYVLLRTQEIEDDGTYVINNREQGGNYYIEMKLNPHKTGKLDFNIQMRQANNKEKLNYLYFIRDLNTGKKMHIYILSRDEDLVAGRMTEIDSMKGAPSLEEEIDLLERVCEIEDYFQVTLVLGNEITQSEYDMVIRVSDLIRSDEVLKTWDRVTFTGILDQHLREELTLMGEKSCRLSYIGTAHVEMFGAEFEFHFMRTFKSAQIVDYDKVIKKAEVLDDGDEIKITFRAGDDKEMIDTLKIPDNFGNES